MSKMPQKFTQNRQTVVMVISIDIYRCLKRDRDIARSQNSLHVYPRLKLCVKQPKQVIKTRFKKKMSRRHKHRELRYFGNYGAIFNLENLNCLYFN